MKDTLSCHTIANAFLSDVDTGLFNLSHISTGHPMSPESERKYKLDFNGMVTEGKLVLGVSYNRHQYNKDTIMKFVDCFGGSDVL